MWRFSALVLILALILSAGHREAWRETFLGIGDFILSSTQYGLLVVGVDVSQLKVDVGKLISAAPSVGEQSHDEQNTAEQNSSGGEGEIIAVAQSSPSTAGGQPPLSQKEEGAGAPKQENGLETLDAASYVPLSVSTSEIKGVASTPDVRPQLRLAEAMQAELARLGCYDGPRDNVWGSSSSKAMRRLNQLAKLRLRSSEPSIESLNALKDVGEPLCGPSRSPAGKGEKSILAPKIQDRLAVEISSSAVGLQADADKGTGEQNGSYIPSWMQGAETANPQAGESQVEQSPDRRANDAPQSSSARKSGSSHSARAAARAHREWRARARQREARQREARRSSPWSSLSN